MAEFRTLLATMWDLAPADVVIRPTLLSFNVGADADEADEQLLLNDAVLAEQWVVAQVINLNALTRLR